MLAIFADIVKHALDRGLTIHPLRPRAKEPCLNDWPNRASRDPSIVAEWASRFPQGNYGVVANEEFCVLDVDDWEAFRLAIPGDLPAAYTVKTSRGKHLYFRHTERSRRLGNRGAGIFDFMADRKFVVGEGSVHPSGRVYECIDPSPIIAIPDALVDALDRYVNERKVERKAQGLKAGDRQDMLDFAGRIFTRKMKDGEQRAEMLEMLQAKNEADSEVLLSDGDLARMVQSAFKDWEPAGDGQAPTVTFGGAKATAEWSLENFTAIQSRPIRWLWKDYLALGKMTTINGEPGSGKSLIMLDTAARLTNGQDWADGTCNTIEPSDVLLLTLEEDAADTIKPRFLAAGGDPRRLYRIAVNGRAAFFKIEEDRARLMSIFREHEIKLVILDPMLDFVSAEANKDADVRDVLTRLVDLAQEFEFSVAGINHLNKKSDLAAMHRVAGARGWTSVARINFLVGRGESEIDGVGLRHVCPLKLNLSADDRGSLDFTIKTQPITDGLIVRQEYAYVNWTGRGEASADEITMAQPGKSSAVESWLREFLRGGTWWPVKDIHSAAEAVTNFSQGQIKRGLGKVGAEWRRTNTMPAVTEWRLVSQSEQAEAEGV